MEDGTSPPGGSPPSKRAKFSIFSSGIYCALPHPSNKTNSAPPRHSTAHQLLAHHLFHLFRPAGDLFGLSTQRPGTLQSLSSLSAGCLNSCPTRCPVIQPAQHTSPSRARRTHEARWRSGLPRQRLDGSPASTRAASAPLGLRATELSLCTFVPLYLCTFVPLLAHSSGDAFGSEHLHALACSTGQPRN